MCGLVNEFGLQNTTFSAPFWVILFILLLLLLLLSNKEKVKITLLKAALNLKIFVDMQEGDQSIANNLL